LMLFYEQSAVLMGVACSTTGQEHIGLMMGSQAGPSAENRCQPYDTGWIDG
jgi:hypothetical protein